MESDTLIYPTLEPLESVTHLRDTAFNNKKNSALPACEPVTATLTTSLFVGLSFVCILLAWVVNTTHNMVQLVSEGKMVGASKIESQWIWFLADNLLWLSLLLQFVGAMQIILLWYIRQGANRYRLLWVKKLAGILLLVGVFGQTAIYPFTEFVFSLSTRQMAIRWAYWAYFFGNGLLLARLVWPNSQQDKSIFEQIGTSPIKTSEVVIACLAPVLYVAATALSSIGKNYEILSLYDCFMLLALSISLGGFVCSCIVIALLFFAAAKKQLAKSMPGLSLWPAMGTVILTGTLSFFLLLRASHNALSTQLHYIQMDGGLYKLELVIFGLSIFLIFRMTPFLSVKLRTHLFNFFAVTLIPWLLYPSIWIRSLCIRKGGQNTIDLQALQVVLFILLIVLSVLPIDPIGDWMNFLSLARVSAIFLIIVGLITARGRTVKESPTASISKATEFRLLPSIIFCMACAILSLEVFVNVEKKHGAAKAALIEHCRLAEVLYTPIEKIRKHLNPETSLDGMWGKTAIPETAFENPRKFEIVPPNGSRTQGFNILLIVIDALRFDGLSLCGNPRPVSPNLDKIINEEGFFYFKNGFSQFNATNSAVPSLLAGQPIWNRGQSQTKQTSDTSLNLLHLLTFASDNATLFFSFGHGVGFMFSENSRSRKIAFKPTKRGTAEEFIEAFYKEMETLGAEERFVAYMHLFDTHNKLWKKRQGVDFGDKLRDLYDNNIAYTDFYLSRLFDFLRKKGFWENTIVIITSDHGEQFFDHGGVIHGYTLYEEEIRVPIFVRIPGRKGEIICGSIMLTDLLPMVLKEMGYSILGCERTIPSIDTLRTALPHKPQIEYFVSLFKQGEAIRYKNRYKLIYKPDLDIWRLYDLANDPKESHNLIDTHRILAEHILRKSEQFSSGARVAD